MIVEECVVASNSETLVTVDQADGIVDSPSSDVTKPQSIISVVDDVLEVTMPEERSCTPAIPEADVDVSKSPDPDDIQIQESPPENSAQEVFETSADADDSTDQLDSIDPNAVTNVEALDGTTNEPGVEHAHMDSAHVDIPHDEESAEVVPTMTEADSPDPEVQDIAKDLEGDAPVMEDEQQDACKYHPDIQTVTVDTESVTVCAEPVKICDEPVKIYGELTIAADKPDTQGETSGIQTDICTTIVVDDDPCTHEEHMNDLDSATVETNGPDELDSQCVGIEEVVDKSETESEIMGANIDELNVDVNNEFSEPADKYMEESPLPGSQEPPDDPLRPRDTDTPERQVVEATSSTESTPSVKDLIKQYTSLTQKDNQQDEKIIHKQSYESKNYDISVIDHSLNESSDVMSCSDELFPDSDPNVSGDAFENQIDTIPEEMVDSSLNDTQSSAEPVSYVETDDDAAVPGTTGEELRDANKNDTGISCTGYDEPVGSNDVAATGGEVGDASLNDTQLTNGDMSEMGQDTGGEELRDDNKNDTGISTDSAGYVEPDGNNDVPDTGGQVEDSSLNNTQVTNGEMSEIGEDKHESESLSAEQQHDVAAELIQQQPPASTNKECIAREKVQDSFDDNSYEPPGANLDETPQASVNTNQTELVDVFNETDSQTVSQGKNLSDEVTAQSPTLDEQDDAFEADTGIHISYDESFEVNDPNETLESEDPQDRDTDNIISSDTGQLTETLHGESLNESARNINQSCNESFEEDMFVDELTSSPSYEPPVTDEMSCMNDDRNPMESHEVKHIEAVSLNTDMCMNRQVSEMNQMYDETGVCDEEDDEHGSMEPQQASHRSPDVEYQGTIEKDFIIDIQHADGNEQDEYSKWYPEATGEDDVICTTDDTTDSYTLINGACGQEVSDNLQTGKGYMPVNRDIDDLFPELANECFDQGEYTSDESQDGPSSSAEENGSFSNRVDNESNGEADSLFSEFATNRVHQDMNIVDQPDETFIGDLTDENMLHDSEHGQISHDTKLGTIEIDQNWDSTDVLFNELAVERATNSPDTSTSNMPDDEPSSNTTPADGTTLCDMTAHEHLTVGHDSKDIAKPMNGTAMPQDQLLSSAITCGSSKNIDLEGNSDGEVLFNELVAEQSEHVESPVPRDPLANATSICTTHGINVDIPNSEENIDTETLFNELAVERTEHMESLGDGPQAPHANATIICTSNEINVDVPGTDAEESFNELAVERADHTTALGDDPQASHDSLANFEIICSTNEINAVPNTEENTDSEALFNELAVEQADHTVSPGDDPPGDESPLETVDASSDYMEDNTFDVGSENDIQENVADDLDNDYFETW